MDLPHCAVFIKDAISYIIMLPEDLPSNGMPIILRTNITEMNGVLVLDFVDRPGNGISVDIEVINEMKNSARLFIFVADENSRGIVAEVIPSWDGKPHRPDLGF